MCHSSMRCLEYDAWWVQVQLVYIEVAGKDLIRENQKERKESKENRNEGSDLELSCVHEGNNGGDLCVLLERGE